MVYLAKCAILKQMIVNWQTATKDEKKKVLAQMHPDDIENLKQLKEIFDITVHTIEIRKYDVSRES